MAIFLCVRLPFPKKNSLLEISIEIIFFTGKFKEALKMERIFYEMMTVSITFGVELERRPKLITFILIS